MNCTGFIENVVLREMFLKYKISKEVDKSQVGIFLVHQVFRSSSQGGFKSSVEAG